MAVKKTSLTRGVVGSQEGGKRLAELDRRLMQCKRSFEMYFNGLEKTPPLREFDALRRSFRELTRTNYSTSVLRFKVNNLVARWQTWRALWERQLQKMEDGTLKSSFGARQARSADKNKRSASPGRKKP